MTELPDTMKEKVRFEVCHDLNGTACISCVLAKMQALDKIVKEPFASAKLKELCGLEALYALSLLPAHFDTQYMQMTIQNALAANEVVH